MKIKISVILFVFVILLSLLSVQGAPCADDTPKKVAILPFTMNADRDLTFLQAGIVDMLSSRLAWKEKVEVLEKGVVKKEVASVSGPLDKKKALTIGKALGADYVILGSLTVFGDSVSIDAKILDVAKSDELVTAFEQTKGMDGVIPTVNQFAEDINAKIMGKEVYRPAHARQREEQPATALIDVADMGATGGLKPSFVQRFKLEIRGLDTGDLDGDGKIELVMIDKKTVFIYKWRKGRLFQFQAIEGSWSPNYIYVSVADLNGDGRSEIYVSNLTATNASAVVLEWEEGKKFKQIVGGEKWLIRVVDLPGRGKTLVGQLRGVEGTYRGGVHMLARKGDRFVSTGPLKLPRLGNVFNFVQSDLAGKGGIFTTLLGPYEHLMVYNQEGQRIWKSDDFFGGSLTYMDNVTTEQNRMVQAAVRVFLPSPIFLFDINDDGKEEIVICQNHSKVARIFGDFRWFGSGKVLFLDWDGAGLVSRWTSQKLSGTVVGYRIADLDNDGRQELAIASITSESYFIGMPRSRLVVYKLK